MSPPRSVRPSPAFIPTHPTSGDIGRSSRDTLCMQRRAVGHPLARPISPRGVRGDSPPSFRFPGGGRGFWGEERGPKGSHTRRVFRARGLYTIKERLADFGRSDKWLKRLEFCGILAGGAPLRSRACAPQIPCLRPSDPVPAPLRSRAYFQRRSGGLRVARCFC